MPAFWLQFLIVRASSPKWGLSAEQLPNLDVQKCTALRQTHRCGRIRPLILRFLIIQAEVFHQNFFQVQHKHNWWSQNQFPASAKLLLIPYLLIPTKWLDESYMSLGTNIFQLSFSHFWFCVCIHFLRKKVAYVPKKFLLLLFLCSVVSLFKLPHSSSFSLTCVYQFLTISNYHIHFENLQDYCCW